MNAYHRFITIITVSLAISCPAVVSADWLQQGSDFLKSLGGDDSKSSSIPANTEIAGAFRHALVIGSSAVVRNLGKDDGFFKDPDIHIPLPENMAKAQKLLQKVGMGDLVDDLELKLNRAAEAATPKSKKIFIETIKGMSFEDVKKIYEGPDNSATMFFQAKMTPALKKAMAPIVEQTMSEVGVVKSYDNFMSQYKSIPFVPDVKANLTEYVIEKGLDGIFFYLAKEEAEIRKNPVRHTTDLLKKVFGAK